MSKKLSSVLVLASLTGCAGTTLTASTATTMPEHVEIAPTITTTGASEAAPMTASNEASTEMVLTELPAAPWAGAPISAREAPRAVVRAWQSADNHSTCAPVAPSAFGAADDARGRESRVAGGWVVEFDRPGLPGVDRAGNECDTCGRSVFGIAGTSMDPEELFDAESPTFEDGSHLLVEVSDGDGESVASATFTVAGQGCVYEVWSFLGPEHLSELVSSLRLVEPAATGTAVATAE